MITIFISAFAWVMLQFRGSSVLEDEAKPETKKDPFLEMLAKAPPRKSKEDLFKIINSSTLSDYDERDLVTLVQDGMQVFIRPGMGEEETFHVRTTLIKALGSLSLLQSDRLYGGQVSERKSFP